MKPTEEQLMAYADGELGPEERARVEAAMAADPAIAAAVARALALRTRLNEAFAPILDEPVPAHLLALASGAAAPPTATVHALPRRTRPRWALPEWTAMAAALVLGIAVSQFALRPAQGPLATQDGELVAAGALAASLESRVGTERVDGLRLGLSFRSLDGGYCRTFQLASQSRPSGLACRDPSGRWSVPVLVNGAAGPEGDLRQATSALPDAVLAEVDARIAGEPLDAAQERAARDDGWR